MSKYLWSFCAMCFLIASTEGAANAQQTKDGNGDSPPAAAAATEGIPSELVMKVTLEEDAADPLTFVLRDTYSRPLKTWENVTPGKVRLELPELERDRYSLVISATGYQTRYVNLATSRQKITVNLRPQHLFRRRYAILRYAVNTKGERTLTGADVKEGRVAVSDGAHLPDLHGDWMIRQQGELPMFSMHRIYEDNGFVQPPAGTTFEEIDVAPEPDQYKAHPVVAEKGIVLLNRIRGNEARELRYAKILVEDITETPPKDIEIIDKFLPPAPRAAGPTPETKIATRDKTSGQVAVTSSLEDGASTRVKLELRDGFAKTIKVWNRGDPGEIRATLPGLEGDRYSLVALADGYSPVSTPIQVSEAGVEPAQAQVQLHRIRYLIVRYAMNTKGERNLTGENVKEGRVAIVFGQIPDLRDWSVIQAEGNVQASIHRIMPNTGFARGPAGKTFDEVDLAPTNEVYTPRGFVFKKGMILCNRVTGNRPEDARYAKLLVEDLTETPPEDLKLIDSRGK